MKPKPQKTRKLSDDERTCIECEARCCRYFCFQIDKPATYEEFENARWFLMHEGISIHMEDNGDWYMSITNICKNLDPDTNRCLDYVNRPLICRKYHADGCDFTLGDYGYKALFTTPQQMENYARLTLGPQRFERIRANAAARARKKRKK